MVEQLALIPSGSRVACRDCRVVFEDLNGHKLCDQCLCDHINGAGELELDNDEIDWETPRSTPQAHITCRVCDRPATVPFDHPALLCPECMGDPDATRQRVADWLASALRRLDENKAQWGADVAASPAADRWPAIQGALIAVAERRATQAALDATWAKRKAEGGPLAQLLIAYEAYAQEADRIGEELARLYAAQREINAAWLNTPMEESEPRMPRPN